ISQNHAGKDRNKSQEEIVPYNIFRTIPKVFFKNRDKIKKCEIKSQRGSRRYKKVRNQRFFINFLPPGCIELCAPNRVTFNIGLLDAFFHPFSLCFEEVRRFPQAFPGKGT